MSSFWILAILFALVAILLTIWVISRIKKVSPHEEPTARSISFVDSDSPAVASNQRVKSAIENITKSQELLFSSSTNKMRFLKVLRTELAEIGAITNANVHRDIGISNALQSFPEPSVNPNQVTTDITLVCKNLSAMLNALAGKKGAKINWQLTKEVFVNLPESFIIKMIRELLSNALLHNAYKVQIDFDLSVTEQYCIINIIDAGNGMSYKTQCDIFERSLNCLPKGRRQTDVLQSIDLPLIISVLNSYGGNLEIVTALTCGTRITLYLPLAKTKEQSQFQKQKALTGISANTDILYFALDKTSNEKLVNFLEQRYKVGVIKAADELIEVAAEFLPKIIICDGYAASLHFSEYAKMLKSVASSAETAIICLTEPVSNEQRFQLFSAQIDQLLQQPITLAEVELVIENLLRQKRLIELRVAEAIANYTVVQLDEDYSGNKVDEFTSQFNTCLENNYSDPHFSQEQCAKLMFMSTRSLQRKISHHLASSFRDCLRRYRIEIAKDLIMKGESVTNAGLMAGFSSSSYFAKCFKAELGYIPSTLSKRLGQS